MDPSAPVEQVPMSSGLLAELQNAAAEDRRPAPELLREAVEQYLESRQWQRVLAFGEAQARKLGLGEDDVLRLIAEARREQAKPGR